MDAWRTELRDLLSSLDTARPPALRRSLKPGFLLTTDLLLAGGSASADAFCRGAEALGWRCAEEKGWIDLTRPVSVPPPGWFEGPFGPEAACCASLLARHKDRISGTEAEEDVQRWAAALLCAGEEGPSAVERVCFSLHRACAERLRLKEPLPPLSLRFFGGQEEDGHPAGAETEWLP